MFFIFMKRKNLIKSPTSKNIGWDQPLEWLQLELDSKGAGGQKQNCKSTHGYKSETLYKYKAILLKKSLKLFQSLYLWSRIGDWKFTVACEVLCAVVI